MRNTLASTLAAAALVATAAGPARAADIALAGDGSWQAFAVDSLRAPITDTLAWIEETGFDVVAFTFVVAPGATASLSVVDAGFSGDAFEVFDGGVSLGTTSAVPVTDFSAAVDIGTDFDAAFAAGGLFSRAVFDLLPGSHRISGRLTQSVLLDRQPLEATVGAVRLDVAAAVPEPETWALLLAGIVATGALARRRRAAGR